MDPDAFSEMYDREADAVLVFVARRVLVAEVALDLTAETFAQAWLGRHRLRGTHELEVRAWLFSIARRQVSRYLRRGRLERGALERLGVQLPASHSDDLAEVDERAGLPALRRELAEQVGRLPDNQQVALRLRVLEERTYDEMASMLGVSEPTARARVSRALRALAKHLNATVASEVNL